MKILFTLILILMMRSGHKSAQVMATKQSCHVQNFDLMSSLVFMWEQLVFLQDLNYELIHSFWNGSQNIAVFHKMFHHVKYNVLQLILTHILTNWRNLLWSQFHKQFPRHYREISFCSHPTFCSHGHLIFTMGIPIPGKLVFILLQVINVSFHV